MSLHTFESCVTLPRIQYNNAVDFFEINSDQIPREYVSIKPTFQIGNIGCRVGEIAFTYATDEEFAGMLFVSDSNLDQRNYDKVLLGGGVKYLHEIPILSFRSHLVAGSRIEDSENEFVMTSVVSDNLRKQGQIRAERKYNDLIRPFRSDEFQIKPQDIYAIARLLKPRAKKQ